MDGVTGIMNGMGASVERFSIKTETALTRSERAFRKMTPAISSQVKQLASFATAGLGIMAVGETFNAIKDYESNLAELRAITGATGKQFDVFKTQIESSAIAQRMSSQEMAKAFTIVGNAQPQLLDNAQGLSEVTNATVTLARAARMELAPAADALTSIMNQFSHGADKAKKDIDIIAGGSRAGSMEILDLSEALKKFGTVASANNVSLLDAATLAELGSQFDKTGEAGIKYRNILLKMSGIHLEDKKTLAMVRATGVDIDLVSNKAIPFNERFKEMAKILKNNDATAKLFGERNVALATGVLNNAAGFDELRSKIDQTGTAEKMAAENSGTLEFQMGALVKAWTNYFTINKKVDGGLGMLKDTMSYIERNMDSIVTVGLYVIGAFSAWWALMKVIRISLFAYNVALGIYNALTGRSTIYTAAQTVAMDAQRVATGLMTAGQWALNYAIEANPIGMIITALYLLVMAIIAVYQHYKALEEIYQRSQQASKTDAINKETASVKGLSAAYQQMGMNKEMADKRATGERVNVLNKVSQSLMPQLADQSKVAARSAANPLNALYNMFTGDKPLDNLAVTAGAIGDAQAAKAALLNPKATQNESLSQTINKNQNKNLTVDFKNVPKGVDISGDDDTGDVTPKVSSTMK